MNYSKEELERMERERIEFGRALRGQKQKQKSSENKKHGFIKFMAFCAAFMANELIFDIIKGDD